MKRAPMKRTKVKRHWDDAQKKVDEEGVCRGCGKTIPQLRAIGRRLEAAHTIGRTYDLKLDNGERLVHPRAIVPLCGPPTDTGTCHNAYDGHELDLWPLMTELERSWACERIGEGQARRRIEGRKL